MTEPESFIDGPAARIIAGLIGLACIALLIFMNWHVLFPPPAKKGG